MKTINLPCDEIEPSTNLVCAMDRLNSDWLHYSYNGAVVSEKYDLREFMIAKFKKE